MKYTNLTNLPEVFETFGRTNKYSKAGADYSVTGLLAPPRMNILENSHKSDLRAEVSEDVFALFGSAVHHVLEQGASFDHTSEERLFAQIGGKNVSGQIDLQEDHEGGVSITDFKVTSVWSVMLGEKQEWVDQLNSYAFLVEHEYRKPITRLQIVGIMRDWKKRESRTKRDYPKSPIISIPIPIKPYEDRLALLEERVAFHEKAKRDWEDAGTLPMCTPDETWERPGKWAVHNKDAIRAKKLFDNVIKAEALANTVKGYKVVRRPGEVPRCADWCRVADWCDQYDAWKKVNGEPK